MPGNQVRVGVGVTGAKGAASEVDQLKDKFANLQKQGAKGFAIGAGAAVTGMALGALGQAAGEAGQFLQDATKAALEEEDSIQKLGTSLRANIPAWDGNTDAIERVLAARMKLGFSDDEQRQSLALLVVATHDANKALDIERTAMDLARLKSISLADASSALIKVEGGQYRALKAMGIVLKEGATQTDALAAVQKAAAGQAEDYANTNSGKLLVSQVKVGEAMEKFGSVTLPAVVAATSTAADGVTNVANAFDLLTHGLSKNEDAASAQIHSTLDLVGALGLVVPGVKDIRTSWDATFGPTGVPAWMALSSDATSTFAGRAQDDLHGVGRSADDTVVPVTKLTAVTDHMASRFSQDAADSLDAIDKLKTGIISDVNDLIDKAFDPAIKHDEMWATARELAAQRAIVASHHSTKEQKRDAADLVTTLEKKLLEEKVALLKMGALSATEQKALVNDLKTSIKNATGPTKAYLQGVLDLILKLQGVSDVTIKVTTNGPAHGPAGKKNAAGFVGTTQGATMGPVGWMGEAGTEAVAILRNPKPIPSGVGAVGGGSGAFTLNVTINASPGMSPGDARALVAAFGPALYADMQRRGMLPRTGTGLTG